MSARPQGNMAARGGVRLGVVLLIALLSGCVTVPPPRTGAHPESIVLFSVTLSGDFANGGDPAGIIVGIQPEEGSAVELAFPPYSRVAGHYATFLARLELPAGRYGLSRLSAIAADGAALPQFGVATRLTFDVLAGTTCYIGHLELQNVPGASDAPGPTTRMIVADAYKKELPYFTRRWPALGAHTIHRNTPRGSTVIPTVPLEDPARLAASRSEATAERAPKLDAAAAASAAVGLPPAARAAFHSFLQRGYPRAFAIAASGSTGTAAGGQAVIQRALANCRRAQHSKHRARCRLFALDDTLL